jgi:hypothetical protein
MVNGFSFQWNLRKVKVVPMEEEGGERAQENTPGGAGVGGVL